MGASRRILLVDDDDYYRGALKKALQTHGCEVTEASDGRGAQHIIGVQPFDLVISDIQMPGLSGVELLKWIKANHSVPVVLITGFSELIETAEAYRLGASDFLIKPFQAEQILQAIEKALTPPSKKGAAAPEQDFLYCRLPLDDFVTGSRIHFNIFLRISASKYVRIAYMGEDISVDRIHAYKSKGVRYVYLLKEDFAKYVGFSLELAHKAGRSILISPEKKRTLLRFTGEVLLESLYVKDLDQEAFQDARSFTETAIGIVSESDGAMAVLDSLNAHADYLYAHSVGVSLYSVLIARAMSWNTSATLFKISLGGLLHDIGLKEIPRATLDKPRAAMSQEERMLYESHAIRGMELMNQVPSAPGDAILIALQHHEDCTGLGYPKRLSRGKIHPLARLIAVADRFCELAIKGPDSPGLPGAEALARLDLVADRLDPEALAALKRVFGPQPSKGAR